MALATHLQGDGPAWGASAAPDSPTSRSGVLCTLRAPLPGYSSVRPPDSATENVSPSICGIAILLRTRRRASMRCFLDAGVFRPWHRGVSESVKGRAGRVSHGKKC